MNQPIREALPTSTGWLFAPTGDFCLFFVRDPKSVIAAPTVITQLWHCSKECIPTKLKTLGDWITKVPMRLGTN